MADGANAQVVTQLCNGDVSEASSVQGTLSALNAGATLVTAALLGVLSDRWGRIPCFIISLARTPGSQHLLRTG